MNQAWPPVPLGELLTKSEDWIAIKPEETYRQITVRLWGQGVVLRNETTGTEIAASQRLRVRKRQFILSRIDARNGAVGLIPDSLDGGVVSSDFPVFTPNPSRILPEFLNWLTKTPHFVDVCKAASEGTTNRVRLKEDKFLAFAIPLPPLDEQRRIVARIEALAAKIEEARGLRKNGTEEAEALSRAVIETAYEQLASKCGIRRLAEACTTITDGDHLTPAFSESGVAFIFVGNVSSGHLHFRNSKRVRREYFKGLRPQRVPQRGDILYSAVGATLGIPAVVDCDEPFCFQRHLAILKPNRTKIDTRFGWYMLRSRTVFATAWSSTTGSAQPTVPLHAIRELPIPIPVLSEQRRTVAYLDGLQAKLDALKPLQAETAAELDALLPSILDRALKGDL